MFLKAGALALALLLVSRVLGLVRESAQAAAFGASGLADVAVLMLTLPDWLTGLLASGALAYVLVPAWAGQAAQAVAASQRKVMLRLLAAGALAAAAIILLRGPLVGLLAGGLPAALEPLAARGLVWSALAVPAALAAALWVTRLQHEGDVTGMYAANLVVNAVLIAAIVLAVQAEAAGGIVQALGLGLLAAMALRLAWLGWRQAPLAAVPSSVPEAAALAPAAVWLWAALSAGLPLALPFVARSVASQSGAGSLATFNYAWKLVELPLVLAIQLVAALAFPAIARAFVPGVPAAERIEAPVHSAFALAWTLACACAAGLLVGAPALAQLLFGWGRMEPLALEQVGRWGAAAAWGLLPQALMAVTLTVLAAQSRLKLAVAAYAVALGALGLLAAAGVREGLALMHWLNALYAAVAVAGLALLGRRRLAGLPWPTFGWSLAALEAVAILAGAVRVPLQGLGTPAGLLAAAAAALAVLALTWALSPVLRQALRR